jgi:tRNA (guanine37-N1)-methyltransferase
MYVAISLRVFKMRKGLKAVLANRLDLPQLKLLYKSYDIVGDIAIIRIPETLKQYSGNIAEAIMQTHKHIKTVLRQVSPVTSDYRLRELELVTGERKTETIHKEYDCIFKVDLKRCYFSPRLVYERMRIAQQIQLGETVVNMFAGVGCYSILIAKHSRPEKIYSIDINPIAIRYMRENVKLNKVGGLVVSFQGDAKTVVEEKLRNIADRVLMPLPEKAYKYLDHAVLTLKPTGGWIHYYDFEHAEKDENPIEKVKARVAKKLQNFGVIFETPFRRIVRTTGPRWYQIVLDIRIIP